MAGAQKFIHSNLAGVPESVVNDIIANKNTKTVYTDEGNCKFYYVTATTISTSSRMWKSYTIPMNTDKVSSFINSVVDIYVGKVAGEAIGALAWWTNFLPWELLLDPPSSHYNTTATYVISAQYVTNAKFVWCYSPTMYKYFLSVVLNSTSVRELHDNQYVYNGRPYGETEEKNYTLDCNNYTRVASVTREYWEGHEDIHLKYIKKIEYYYNDNRVTSIFPPYAQSYYDTN